MPKCGVAGNRVRAMTINGTDYISTRGNADALDFAGVTLTGLARDGGLYVPRHWPQFSTEDI
ncbi:hypothetical protein, partial [Sphingorhabdus sp.]|uniref:hypothetical protein n=1 Tax=Sphingorhabdus sp. TaxID=1902408 RepID=UPI003531B0B2